MEKQKKSIGAIALVVLLLILTIVSLILATYAWAKYTTTRTGSATATVAAWNVDFSQSGTFVESASHVATGKVAPGTQGSFTVGITPTNTEVCFNYSIVVNNIKFYRDRIASDGEGDTPIALTDATVLGTYNNGTQDVNVTVADLKSHIDVYYTANNTDIDIVRTENATQQNPATEVTGTYDITANPALSGNNTIKWKWDFQLDEGTDAQKLTYNGIDTAAGTYANDHGLTMEINYTITATQVRPGAQNH